MSASASQHKTQLIDGVLHVMLKGPLLIGGYSTPLGPVDATPARVFKSRKQGDQGAADFLLPASTLKGALREACTRLALAKGLPACDLVAPCAKEPRCLICQLFGAPGPDRPLMMDKTGDALAETADGRLGALRLGNAEMADPSGELLSSRPGVGIDRQLGAAADEVLFQREILDGAGRSFAARVWGRLSDGARDLLIEALPLVNGLGGSRTRGFGEVEVRYEQRTLPVETAISFVEPVAAAATFEVEALEPLVLGDIPPSGTVHNTLRYLPGSALRGAVGAATLAQGLSPDDAVFRRLFVQVDAHDSLRFSDAWPRPKSKAILPVPKPLSLLRCKHAENESHADIRGADVLVAAALAERVLADGGHWVPPPCKKCQRPMQPVHGLEPRVDLITRIVTRLGRDGRTGSAMPGLLYAVEAIQPDPEIVFAGTVSGLDDEARKLLAQVTDLRIGRGRNRGQGRIRLRIGSELVKMPGLGDRRRGFADTFASMLETAGKYAKGQLPKKSHCLLAVLACTDLGLDPATAPQDLQSAIYGPGKLPGDSLSTYQAIGTRSGWDQTSDKGGPRPIRPVVRAGSVWLFSCGTGESHQCPTDDYLARLEQEGVGQGRELGLGHIMFNPLILCEGIAS